MKSTAVPALARLLIVLLLTMIGGRIAAADDVATRAAKRHYERGEKLFSLGKFEDALDEFEQAFDAMPIPDFLFNIGQCHRNLGAYDAAIFSFKKFLRLEPDAPNHDQVQELIDELEAKKERDDTNKFGLVKQPPDAPVTTESPIYKKWWFWTGVAVVGVAGGVGVYAATRADGPPTTNLGNIVFGL